MFFFKRDRIFISSHTMAAFVFVFLLEDTGLLFLLLFVAFHVLSGSILQQYHPRSRCVLLQNRSAHLIVLSTNPMEMSVP